MEMLIGLITGLFLFICCLTAYTTGLRHGKTLSKGEVPKLELNPLKPIIRTVNQHKQAKEQEQAFDDLDVLMNYNKVKALEAIKAKGS
jgi:hypothetical protein